ncbi:hypothetical protein Vretimale_11175 [Volvox reticuliferus]|nr:hypothetical protein Vretimale_11175 [Volvox reticuliferus]
MGVDKVLCVTVEDPAKVAELATKLGASGESRVELLADRNCGLVRLLGLEIGTLEGAGPKCQRYAAVVEDGVLLKLRVESAPADLKVTDAKSMIALWKCIYPNACA